MKKAKQVLVFLILLLISGAIVLPKVLGIDLGEKITRVANPTSIFTNTTPKSSTSSSRLATPPTKPNSTFRAAYQIKLSPLDLLKRATGAQIQLQAKDLPSQKREPRLSYNPVGWHNYKFNGHWLMNRGHLVGYQFSGLNDEPKNLVPETAYLNAGSLSGMDDSNPKSMLYYENRLAVWLKTHPNDWLNYQVTPLYKANELIPRQVSLSYHGFDKKGKAVKVAVGGNETIDDNGNTQVTLDNISPNAIINYSDGTAVQK
ncbi:DNA/RNA non-specific endonuclease [Lactococcus kimchii]|uniref:DNA/RNA non-specific endonuclease n=1 Tax=Lactococcus sp. S-13 TaxID=2507158 RepID=UPI001023B318|nr:DNAse [Lactococcus sp. S-13]